jgi:hypothetical protein
VSTFVKGLAWTVAFLSGVATIFALFGGQQWLEQQGWTLAPSTAPDTGVTEQATDPTPDASGTATAESEETEAAEPEPVDTRPQEADGVASAWASVSAWSERTFDNLLWGIVAFGVSMLVAGAAGALIAAAQYWIYIVLAFFQWTLAVILVGAVVAMGFMLHGADPGYLGWFIALTVISAPLGYFVHDEYG